jgi:hypothetical protein
MAALTGPIPKREESRVRATEPGQEITKVPMTGKVTPPKLSAYPGMLTHTLTKGFWESLKESGQAKYYEPSDWMTALTALHLLDKQLSSERGISPTMVASVWQMLASIAVTEGERRRIRLEVERKTADADSEGDATVIPISEVIANRLRSQQQA